MRTREESKLPSGLHLTNDSPRGYAPLINCNEIERNVERIHKAGVSVTSTVVPSVASMNSRLYLEDQPDAEGA